MRSKLLIYSLTIATVLLISVVVSKVTLEDKVVLNSVDQECLSNNWNTLYDSPLEYLGINVLGKTIVTKKDWDILYTKSYTFFRIPVGEAVFQCPDGSAFKIPQTEVGITQAIEEAKYCEVKSDCVPVEAKCPFGCNVYVNQAEAWRIQTFIDSYESQCIYSCLALQGYDCVNNRCETKFNIASRDTYFVYGLGTYSNTPAVEGQKSFQSDLYGISFQYPKNYLLFEIKGKGFDGREYYVVTLHEDSEFIRDAMAGELPGATEWPPSIHFSFYREPNRTLSLEDWVRTNKLERNYAPEIIEDVVLTSITVAGMPAVAYKVAGLYFMNIVAFAYDEWVVVAAVDSFDPEGDENNETFEAILKTIKTTKS